MVSIMWTSAGFVAVLCHMLIWTPAYGMSISSPSNTAAAATIHVVTVSSPAGLESTTVAPYYLTQLVAGKPDQRIALNSSASSLIMRANSFIANPNGFCSQMINNNGDFLLVHTSTVTPQGFSYSIVQFNTVNIHSTDLQLGEMSFMPVSPYFNLNVQFDYILYNQYYNNWFALGSQPRPVTDESCRLGLFIYANITTFSADPFNTIYPPVYAVEVAIPNCFWGLRLAQNNVANEWYILVESPSSIAVWNRQLLTYDLSSSKPQLVANVSLWTAPALTLIVYSDKRQKLFAATLIESATPPPAHRTIREIVIIDPSTGNNKSVISGDVFPKSYANNDFLSAFDDTNGDWWFVVSATATQLLLYSVNVDTATVSEVTTIDVDDVAHHLLAMYIVS